VSWPPVSADPVPHPAATLTKAHRLTIGPHGIVARLNNRTYSPVLRTAKIPPVPIPWWNDRTLTIEIGPPNPDIGIDSLYENPS
jgi:hypothetical protein